MKWLKRLPGWGSRSPKTASLVPARHSLFRAGQVWRYRCRVGEDASRVIVGKVEETNSGHVVVHVQLSGLSVRNPDAPSGRSSLVRHLPIAAEQLAASVVELVSAGGMLVGFDEGYNAWRGAYEAGRGGIFTLPLAEIVESMEQAIAGGGRTSG